jgi:hypothetical protein
MRVIGATERRFFTVWPFITIGAKSAPVSMSIVQTSKTIKSGALRSKAQDHTLVRARFSFCGRDTEDGVNDKQYIVWR